MKESLAYRAMVNFLDDRYQRMPSDALGALLGELALQQDGGPADPAVVSDWDRAMRHASAEEEAPAGVTAMRRKAG